MSIKAHLTAEQIREICEKAPDNGTYDVYKALRTQNPRAGHIIRKATVIHEDGAITAEFEERHDPH